MESRYVTGPIIYSAYRGTLPDVDGILRPRVVHLFGETHQERYGLKYDCSEPGIPIEDFLKDQIDRYISEHPTEQIDLFLETPHEHKSTDTFTSTDDWKPGKIAIKFAGNSSVRVHNIDFRMSKHPEITNAPVLDMLMTSVYWQLLRDVDGETKLTVSDLQYAEKALLNQFIGTPELLKFAKNRVEILKNCFRNKSFLEMVFTTPDISCFCGNPISPVSLSGRYCSEHYLPDYSASESTLNLLKKFQSFHRTIYIKDLQKMDFLLIINHPRIVKQYQNIWKPLGSRIIRLFNLEFDKRRESIDWNKALENFLRIHGRTSDAELLLEDGSVVELGAIVMDTYALGRLFRSFQDKTFPKTAIFYTGAFHTANYINILNQLLPQIVADQAPKTQFCLSMKGFNMEVIKPTDPEAPKVPETPYILLVGTEPEKVDETFPGMRERLPCTSINPVEINVVEFLKEKSPPFSYIFLCPSTEDTKNSGKFEEFLEIFFKSGGYIAVFLGINKKQFEDYIQKNSRFVSIWDLQQDFKIRKKVSFKEFDFHPELKREFEIESSLDIIPNDGYVAVMLRSV